MTPQRRGRLITFLLFVSVGFVPAYAQEAPLNGFDDYANPALGGKPRFITEAIVRNRPRV